MHFLVSHYKILALGPNVRRRLWVALAKKGRSELKVKCKQSVNETLVEQHFSFKLTKDYLHTPTYQYSTKTIFKLRMKVCLRQTHQAVSTKFLSRSSTFLICFQAPRFSIGLLHLPTELLCDIFSYLDRSYSTCLGVSSRRLYDIHRYLHPCKVSLASSTIEKRPYGKIICVNLRSLLKKWMGPRVVYPDLMSTSSKADILF